VSRFAQFTKRERMTMHHALRMLAKFPDEDEAATPLADEIWNEHSEEVEMRSKYLAARAAAVSRTETTQ
jgi:hypothetical protein